MIAVPPDALQRSAPDRHDDLNVTSGFVWYGTDQLASIEPDGLYGLGTKQKFVATDEKGKASYLDGQPLYLHLEHVNGGIRISSDSHRDAIAKFISLASGSKG